MRSPGAAAVLLLLIAPSALAQDGAGGGPTGSTPTARSFPWYLDSHLSRIVPGYLASGNVSAAVADFDNVAFRYNSTASAFVSAASASHDAGVRDALSAARRAAAANDTAALASAHGLARAHLAGAGYLALAGAVERGDVKEGVEAWGLFTASLPAKDGLDGLYRTWASALDERSGAALIGDANASGASARVAVAALAARAVGDLDRVGAYRAALASRGIEAGSGDLPAGFARAWGEARAAALALRTVREDSGAAALFEVGLGLTSVALELHLPRHDVRALEADAILGHPGVEKERGLLARAEQLLRAIGDIPHLVPIGPIRLAMPSVEREGSTVTVTYALEGFPVPFAATLAFRLAADPGAPASLDVIANGSVLASAGVHPGTEAEVTLPAGVKAGSVVVRIGPLPGEENEVPGVSLAQALASSGTVRFPLPLGAPPPATLGLPRLGPPPLAETAAPPGSAASPTPGALGIAALAAAAIVAAAMRRRS